MRRSLYVLGLILVIFLISAPTLAAGGPAAKVSDLAWMTGHWEGPTGNGTLEENWTQPKSGSIGSLVRATNGDATSMIELIVIEEEEEGSLVLRLQAWNPGFEPLSEAPQEMTLVESSENKVVFEAVGEGGLKRLGYSRAANHFTVHVTTAQGQEFSLELAAK